MNNQRITRWVAIVGAIAVVAGGLWLGRRTLTVKAADSTTKAAAAARHSSPPRKVEVVKPARRTMSRSLNVPATIEAFETADLYARVSGYVGEVRVDIGDAVKEGDCLATIDVPEMADELRQAEAAHRAKEAGLAQMRSLIQTARAELGRFEAEKALKKITFDRKQELRKGNAIPQQELDQATGELEVAEAQVRFGHARVASAESDAKSAEAEVVMALAAIARLRTLMEYATLKSPFDGVVSRRLVDRGALVQPVTSSVTKPLFTVQRIDQFRIFIEVPEADIPHVRAGTVAKVKPYGMPDLSFEGTVARTASSLNPGTRTMRTEIDLANKEGALMHGMYAQVVLELDRHENALTVPATALLTEANQTFVFTVGDGRAQRLNIRTGLDDGIHVEVTEGLDDNALVILAGKGLISDGSPVEPVLRSKPNGS